MSDPIRIVDETGDDGVSLERELLGAGKRDGLASRDKDQIWLGLTAQLGAPVAPSGHGAGAAKALGGAKALTASAALKGAILAVALGGGVVVGVQRLGHHVAAPAPVVAPVLTPARAPAPPSPAPTAAATPPGSQDVRARRSSDMEAAKLRPAASQLEAEGRVVLDARRALRDGRPEEALRQLEAAHAAFPGGELAQEREALTIEALARAGQRDAARARAVAFLRAHPESPHAATVRSYAAP